MVVVEIAFKLHRQMFCKCTTGVLCFFFSEYVFVMGRNRNRRASHSVQSTNVPMSQRSDYVDLCRNIIRDMDLYGVCVLDNFLGYQRGMTVLDEVLNLYNMGVFKDGQLVRNKASNNLKTIRGDQIIWVDGREDCCKQIGQLISDVDAVVMGSNKMNDNGKLGNYTINGRTKVSCLKNSLYSRN